MTLEEFKNFMCVQEDTPIYPNQCLFELYNPETDEPSKNKDTDYRIHIYFKKESDKDKHDDIRGIAHPHFQYLLGNTCENEFEHYTQDEIKEPYLYALDTALKAKTWLRFIGMREKKF